MRAGTAFGHYYTSSVGTWELATEGLPYKGRAVGFGARIKLAVAGLGSWYKVHFVATFAAAWLISFDFMRLREFIGQRIKRDSERESETEMDREWVGICWQRF